MKAILTFQDKKHEVVWSELDDFESKKPICAASQLFAPETGEHFYTTSVEDLISHGRIIIEKRK